MLHKKEKMNVKNGESKSDLLLGWVWFLIEEEEESRASERISGIGRPGEQEEDGQ
jgi:hypothetical protein